MKVDWHMVKFANKKMCCDCIRGFHGRKRKDVCVFASIMHLCWRGMLEQEARHELQFTKIADFKCMFFLLK